MSVFCLSCYCIFSPIFIYIDNYSLEPYMSSTQISTSLAVSENGFLFLPTTGETFTVNETGRFILRRLQEGREQQEIISSLIDEFDVEPVNGRMPQAVSCPVCCMDGTAVANEIIAQVLATQTQPSPITPSIPSKVKLEKSKQFLKLK